MIQEKVFIRLPGEILHYSFNSSALSRCSVQALLAPAAVDLFIDFEYTFSAFHPQRYHVPIRKEGFADAVLSKGLSTFSSLNSSCLFSADC
jgi:hypothetical protein